jgi:hypothetical protein
LPPSSSSFIRDKSNDGVGHDAYANRSEFSTGIIFGLQGMPERIAIGIAIASSRGDRQL